MKETVREDFFTLIHKEAIHHVVASVRSGTPLTL
jgi:hypothetical protein